MFSNTFNVVTHNYQQSIAEMRAAGMTRDAWAMEALLDRVHVLEERTDPEAVKGSLENMESARGHLDDASSALQKAKDAAGDFTLFETLGGILKSVNKGIENLTFAGEALE